MRSRAKRLAVSTMMVRAPLLAIRASMAVKPGRLSMASAPLIQASNLGQGIRSAPYENVRRQSIDRGHRMVGAPNASILIPELRHVEANDSFQKFARRHIAPPFGI